MNKKFSTLVAVLLAAGAWTTLDAKVIEVTSPAVGGSYLVGTGINADESTEYTLLLAADGKAAKAATDAVTAESPVWKLEGSDGNYSLQQGAGDEAKAFFASTTSEATLTLETISGEKSGKAQVLFTIEDGKLKVANTSDFSSNNAIKEKTLYLKLADNTIATIVEDNATAIDFGVYASNNEGALDGFDLTVDDDGEVVLDGFVASSAYDAPVYFQTEDGYLSVAMENGAYVVKASKTAPTAAQSFNASWMWNKGKLISVAAKAAGKDAQLKVKNVETKAAGSVNYSLAKVGSDFTVAGGAIASTDASGLASTALYASAAVNATVAPAATITVTGSQNIVGGTYDLSTSVPSGYCVVALGNGKYLKAGATVSAEAISASDTNGYKNFLWSVAKTEVNGQVYYSFTSLAKDNNDKAYKWMIGSETAFAANEAYEGQGITLSTGGKFIQVDADTEDSEGTAVIGLYKAFSLAHTKAYLDNILNPGFDLTVKVEKDSKETIENIGVFQQSIYPQATNTTDVTVTLWDNKDFKDGKNAKKLVLDLDVVDGSDVSGSFKWLTQKEIDKDATRYEDKFQFQYGLDDADVITRLKVGDKRYVSVLLNDKKYYLTSSEAVTNLPYIKLGGDNIYPVKNLLGKLWNISYADTRANAKADGEEYKLNGILAVTYDKDGEKYVWNKATEKWDKTAIASVADYVASSTVAESAPEAQWMVTSANLTANTFTLTNRENPSVQITGVQLRVRDNDKFEVYISPNAGSSSASTSEKNLKNDENDIVYVTESAKKDNFQGYMQTTENTLRSNNYHLGQYHAIGGNHNAYFVENHSNSHQIGAIADKAEADKWKLHFAMKADDNSKYTEVDTVYVITAFATLNKDGDGWESDAKKIKKDTLAILPYTFQKVANREFVAFNPENKTNFDFYACDGDNVDNSESNYTDAARFALKVKPNGYNFVEISSDKDDHVGIPAEDTYALATSKAYLANSAENGSLERLSTYAPDNNSVMVVEAADASEYHKIAVEWGDTISLFRDENNSQVLFEKRDVKSVVEKDTLSFLNIDNINQFSVNPAIFADTAYINRWDADGVLNTTYQYLLTLNPSFGLHTENCEIPGHDPIIGGIDTVYGRFLVNLIDTANVYGVNHIHSNWYTNDNEAGEKRAKLSFVEGFHTNDTLYLTRQGGEAVKIGMTDPNFNVAKFAFRYVDSQAKTFKIQTQFKEYLGDNGRYDMAEEFADAYDETPGLVSNEGYLKWINGTVVVEKGYENGDVFGIEENVKRDPVANETIGTSSISVVATNGAVIIKGAAGKKVSISNVLGQTVANTVLSSDEATISTPSGVVIVAVEGEAAVKAIVK